MITPVLVDNIRMPIEADYGELSSIICEKLELPLSCISAVRVVRQSLDARKKSDIHYNISAVVGLDSHSHRQVLKQGLAKEYEPPQAIPIKEGSNPLTGRVIVAGFGPAGIFAAYLLAKSGYKPLVIEQGADIDKRSGKVESLFSLGKLDPQTNVMFGEGGAGAFSDGKLTSRSKNPRSFTVIQAFLEHGAPQDIAYMVKPHIGTDILRRVIKSLRNKIISLGGEVCFLTRLEDIEIADGKLRAVKIKRADVVERIEAAALVLATGQSSDSLYDMLLSKGLELEARPFALGVRIEHPQQLINEAQLGSYANNKKLGAAEYALTARCGSRGVYSFCMCPGGYVVAATPDEGRIITNGMSERARDGKNANSAIIVQVGPEDYGKGSLAGLAYRKKIERAAFDAGYGYAAPAQRLEDFLLQRKSKGFYSVEPTYRPGVSSERLDLILPDYICEALAQGIKSFSNKLKGFDYPDAVLTAVESRPSTPVRIVRDESMQATRASGIYPVGEGAGYAGGIMSAAIDGLMAAEAIAAVFRCRG